MVTHGYITFENVGKKNIWSWETYSADRLEPFLIRDIFIQADVASQPNSITEELNCASWHCVGFHQMEENKNFH